MPGRRAPAGSPVEGCMLQWLLTRGGRPRRRARSPAPRLRARDEGQVPAGAGSGEAVQPPLREPGADEDGGHPGGVRRRHPPRRTADRTGLRDARRAVPHRGRVRGRPPLRDDRQLGEERARRGLRDARHRRADVRGRPAGGRPAWRGRRCPSAQGATEPPPLPCRAGAAIAPEAATLHTDPDAGGCDSRAQLAIGRGR